MSQPVDVSAQGAGRRAPGGGRRLWVVLAVGLVVAASIITAVLVWVRHSDRAFEAGYGISMDRPVGVRIWTVLEHGSTSDQGVITIEDIRPNLGRDEAQVEIEYAICVLDADVLAKEGVGGSGYGLRDSSVERYCTRLVPAEGASLELGTTPGQELLVSVRPTRPGRSVVKSHHIEWSEGWERGSADINATVDIRAH